MSIRAFNERIRQVQGPPMERLEVTRNGNSFDSRVVLGATSGRAMQLARISSDLEVKIPWSVADGIYSLTTSYMGILDIFIYGTDNYYTDVRSQNRTSPNTNFDLITYLQVTIDNAIDFGKVIFTAGANALTKRGNISILGGKNSRIKVKVVEPKVLLTKVGTGTETVPIFIKLINKGHTGEEIEERLNDTGVLNIAFEVRLEPGLYPDIPEGKYAGLARFEIKYS